MRQLILATMLFGVVFTGGAPRAAAPSDPIQRAVSWLRTQQLPDGSFGQWLPDHSYRGSASVTADAVYVLALAGENPAGPAWTQNGHSALDALANLAPTYVYSDAGQAGKVARAVVLGGGDPHHFAGMDLIAIIQAAYNPATGRYHPNLLYRDTLAMEGLLRAGASIPPAALNALLQAQLPGGGWFWSFDGTQADVDTTGRVLQLLAGQVGAGCLPAYERAVHFLAVAQVAGGGWGVYPTPNTNPANADSTGLAIAGLRATGHDPNGPLFMKNGHTATASLLAFQQPDGSFVYTSSSGPEVSRLTATFDALNALIQPLGQQPICQLLYLPMLLARG